MHPASRVDSPIVTVLLAVHNGDHFLAETLASLRAQTFHDFELLVVDDASNDETPAILQAWPDHRLRLVRNERQLGLAASLNRGLRLATGRYIARQDADDLSEPARLAQQVGHLEAHLELALLGSWYTEIDAAGQLLRERKLPLGWTDLCWALQFYCPFAHSAVMFRRTEVLSQIGYYDEALSYAPDYDLWLRIARRLPVANLDQHLLRYRVSPWSMTATYGPRLDEGPRLALAQLVPLLDWPADQRASNLARLEAMRTLLFGALDRLEPAAVGGALAQILRLQPRFAREHQLTPAEAARHRAALAASLSERLVVLAARYARSGRPASGWLLLRRALRLHPRVLLSRRGGGCLARLAIASGRSGPPRLGRLRDRLPG
jgi:glycosyl transferase family 2